MLEHDRKMAMTAAGLAFAGVAMISIAVSTSPEEIRPDPKFHLGEVVSHRIDPDLIGTIQRHRCWVDAERCKYDVSWRTPGGKSAFDLDYSVHEVELVAEYPQPLRTTACSRPGQYDCNERVRIGQ